jgi:hypothetical protein
MAGLALLTAAGLYAPLLAVAAPLAALCLGPTLATLFGGAAARPVPALGLAALPPRRPPPAVRAPRSVRVQERQTEATQRRPGAEPLDTGARA